MKTDLYFTRILVIILFIYSCRLSYATIHIGSNTTEDLFREPNSHLWISLWCFVKLWKQNSYRVLSLTREYLAQFWFAKNTRYYRSVCLLCTRFSLLTSHYSGSVAHWGFRPHSGLEPATNIIGIKRYHKKKKIPNGKPEIWPILGQKP